VSAKPADKGAQSVDGGRIGPINFAKRLQIGMKAVLSLRRHDPDQVQRVPAVRRGGCLSSL